MSPVDESNPPPFEHQCKCPTPCCVFKCLRCTHSLLSYPRLYTCRACRIQTPIEWVNYEKWRSTHDTWSTPRHPYRSAPIESSNPST